MAQINWSNPITKNLLFSTDGNITDAVTKVVGNIYDSAIKNQSDNSMTGFKTQGSDDRIVWLLPGKSLSASSPCSLELYVNLKTHNNTASGGIGIATTNSFATSGGGAVRSLFYWDNNQYRYWGGSIDCSSGITRQFGLHHLVVTKSEGTESNVTITFYLDGVMINQQTGDWGIAHAQVSPLYVIIGSRHIFGVAAATQVIFKASVWDRELTSSEINFLAKDPWQTFKDTIEDDLVGEGTYTSVISSTNKPILIDEYVGMSANILSNPAQLDPRIIACIAVQGDEVVELVSQTKADNAFTIGSNSFGKTYTSITSTTHSFNNISAQQFKLLDFTKPKTVFMIGNFQANGVQSETLFKVTGDSAYWAIGNRAYDNSNININFMASYIGDMYYNAIINKTKADLVCFGYVVAHTGRSPVGYLALWSYKGLVGYPNINYDSGYNSIGTTPKIQVIGYTSSSYSSAINAIVVFDRVLPPQEIVAFCKNPRLIFSSKQTNIIEYKDPTDQIVYTSSDIGAPISTLQPRF